MPPRSGPREGYSDPFFFSMSGFLSLFHMSLQSPLDSGYSVLGNLLRCPLASPK